MNIDAICHSAALRAGVGPHDLTKEQVLKLQCDLFHGTTFKPRPDIGSPSDEPELMGQRFETGTAIKPSNVQSQTEEEVRDDPIDTTQPTAKPTLKLEEK